MIFKEDTKTKNKNKNRKQNNPKPKRDAEIMKILLVGRRVDPRTCCRCGKSGRASLKLAKTGSNNDAEKH
jgi:hypothetical protein